jgi:hypothetical protein
VAPVISRAKVFAGFFGTDEVVGGEEAGFGGVLGGVSFTGFGTGTGGGG